MLSGTQSQGGGDDFTQLLQALPARNISNEGSLLRSIICRIGPNASVDDAFASTVLGANMSQKRELFSGFREEQIANRALNKRTTKVRFLALLSMAVLVLSGCTDLGDAPADGGQKIEEVQKPLEGADTEPAPTPSELEACSITPNIISLAKGMGGGKGEVKISEVTSELTHLSAVAAVLESEGSPLFQSLQGFTESFGSMYPILGTDSTNTITSLKLGIEDLQQSLEAVSTECKSLDAGFDSTSLPVTVEDFYPNGFWYEAVTPDFLSYSLYSTDDLYDLSIQGDDVVYQSNGNKALLLVLKCDVKKKEFLATIQRITGDFSTDEFGPDGRIEFSYSLDEGPAKTGSGFFASGFMVPFVSELNRSELEKQGNRTWSVLSETESSISIKMDLPGARFEAELLIGGIERVEKELKSQGCFDF